MTMLDEMQKLRDKVQAQMLEHAQPTKKLHEQIALLLHENTTLKAQLQEIKQAREENTHGFSPKTCKLN